jgi:RNA polymerase sigma-70 factor (ECF subfamily)
LNQNSPSDDYTHREDTSPDLQARDGQLIRMVAARDEKAFEELYQRYSAPVYRYLLRFLGEQHAAEDLLQEVFVAVWRGASGYRGQAQVKTWIYRIAHHQAVSLFRKHHLMGKLDEKVDEGEDDPEQAMIGSWDSECVHRAVDRLSAKHREVLDLAFVHEMSYREIARVVGCPVGTVKSRMSYALRALNRILRIATADDPKTEPE